jgi:hypothetical protein
LVSRELSWASRAAMFEDSRDRPCRAPRNSSGVFSVRSARVFSDSASWSVSMRAERSARPSLAGDLGPLLELTGTGRLEREVHRAEQRLDLDRRPGRLAELDAGVDQEGHLDVVAVEVDLLDLPHADPGHPDLVVGLQAARLGERGVVGVPTADEREVLGPEGGHDERGDHREADRPDDDRVLLAERGAHPRSHLSAPGL